MAIAQSFSLVWKPPGIFRRCPEFHSSHGFSWRQAPAQFQAEADMLYYAFLFFVIALIAAALGFGGIAAGAAGIAKIIFYLFLIIFVVTLVMGLVR